MQTQPKNSKYTGSIKNRRQYNPRAISKNVDPFSFTKRTPRQQTTSMKTRNTRPAQNRHARKFSRGLGPRRNSVMRFRRKLKRSPLKSRHKVKYYRRKRRLPKYHAPRPPYVAPTLMGRRVRNIPYSSRRRNRYYLKKFVPAVRFNPQVRVTIRREIGHSSPVAHGVKSAQRPSFRGTAKNVLKRLFRPSTRPWLVLKRYSDYSFNVRRQRRHARRLARYYRLKGSTALCRVTTKTARPELRADLRAASGKQWPHGFRYKRLRQLFQLADRRKKHKRGRFSQRPGLRRQAKHVAVARQALRKLRALQGPSVRALRRRLLRHKRRYYRRSRQRFLTIRYTRRIRVKRRTARRVRRHIHSTFTVLRGARTRTLQQRIIARHQRRAYLQINRQSSQLLHSLRAPSTRAHRQQLFVHKELRRRLRATRQLISRPANSALLGAHKGNLRAQRAAAHLKRRLSAYTASLPSRKPRPILTSTAYATPRITAAWLVRQQFRVRRKRAQGQRALKVTWLQLNRANATRPLFNYLSQYSKIKHAAEIGVSKKVITSALRKALFRVAPSYQSVKRFGTPKNVTQQTRAAIISIRGERTRFLEMRYYRGRAKLRLPNVRVKRAERKREGLRLFARHTLKGPQTLSGKAALLLPAPDAQAASISQSAPLPAIFGRDLSVPERMRNYHPRVRFRGPRHYEAGIIISSRMRARFQQNLRHLQLRRRNLRKTRTVTPDNTTAQKLEKLTVLIEKTKAVHAIVFTQQAFKTLTFQSEAQQDAAKALFLSRLYAARTKLSSRSVLAKTVSSPSRPAPRATRTRRLSLKTRRTSNTEKREIGLWHLRSTQSMLNTERAFSAWSPQYGTDFRRWSSPRRYGHPMRLRKVSRLTRRLRRLINNILASRNLPKRKYFDRSFGRLQYYRGSAASIGYARPRRVYRPRSKNNRWWKPFKQPVPFTHPYSRRALNAKKNTFVSMKHKLAHHYDGNLGKTSFRNLSWAEPEEKPRIVLNSVFKFRRRRYETVREFAYRVKKERAKMPPTFQWWLPTKLVGAVKVQPLKHTGVVLARTRRSVRKLERLFPKTNAWAGHRWAQLALRQSTTSSATLFTAAANYLSKAFWNRFRILAGTPSKRLAVQKELFIHFRSWQAATATVVVVGGPNFSEYLARAARFIVGTAGKLLPGAAEGTFYPGVETGAFIRRLTSKQLRSWKLRQLPKRRRVIKKKVMSIYHRSNHALRRRWLHGAERYLKRSRVGRLPPKHRRGGDHRMINYGRGRRRFPASGRRKQSYDSTLHAFAKRTSPSRFRLAAVTHFQRIRPKTQRDSKVNRVVYELTRRRRLQRSFAHMLGRAAYLSPAWRELLAFRENSPIALPTTDFAASAKGALLAEQTASAKSPVPYSAQYGHTLSTAAKRRFASLPINVTFKQEQLTRRLLRSREMLPLRAHRLGLLRAALRRRRMERVYVDLKKYTSRRRLSREQLPPAWKRRRLAQKRMSYRRYGDWTPRHFWPAPAKSMSWTLHALEDRVPRRQDRALDVSLRSTHGELLLLTPKTAKKRNWAKKGFRIQLTAPHVKTRRSRQVVRRRRRRSRRCGLGGWVRLHHWSERKNYNNILRRGSYVKRAAAGAIIRQHRRSRAGLLLKRRATVMPLFWKNRRAIEKSRLPLSSVLQTTVLPRFSSLARRRGLKRLHRSAEHRRSRFLRRRTAALGRQVRVQEYTGRDRVDSRQLALRAQKPFVENVVPRTHLAPLTFVHRTRRVIKSDAEKLRAVIWNIKSKELRYKKTAQYTESLTKFIPALMSYMISRQIAQKRLTYTYVKGLISATYWNLRIYLNVDPFAGRLTLRDRKFKQLRFLANTIAKLAKEQSTEHADRIRLRWRFQPCRLQPAPTSDRFRADWLRAFFPRKHSLFQEDPEQYSEFIVSTRNIRRVALTGYGISRARTYPATTNIERRARQLLRMRLSRREPRLETVLQTTRRVSETETEHFVPVLAPESEEEVLERKRILAQRIAEADAAAAARSKKFVFVKKARTPKLTAAEIADAGINLLFDEHRGLHTPKVKERVSFFQRAYSTDTAYELSATTRLIAIQKRLSAINGKQTTTFSDLSARTRVKARLVARGRTNFIASTDFMANAGGLDPRFLRYKSPRSRQYELRTARAATADTNSRLLTLLHFNEKRAALYPLQETRQIIRLRRRHFYLDAPTTSGKRTERVLTTVRQVTPMRRAPAVFHTRVRIARERAIKTEMHNFPNRRQLAFTPPSFHEQARLAQKEERFLSVAPLVRSQLLQHWRTHISADNVVLGERAALLYRHPAQRSVVQLHRADRVVSYRPIRTKRSAVRRGRTCKRAFRILRKVQRCYRKRVAALSFTWPGAPKNRGRKAKRTERGLARLQRAVSTIPGGANPPQHTVPLMRNRVVRFRANAGLGYHRLVRSNSERMRTQDFRVIAFHRIARLSRFTRRCLIRQRISYQTPFDTYRPQLWHMLTHRWMKKHRILKEWLKGVNLWLKDPWLSRHVDPTRRSNNRIPGEIRARELQDGEVLRGGENAGYTKEEKVARRKATKRAIAGAYRVVKKDLQLTGRQIKKAPRRKKTQIFMRFQLSRGVIRKPRPSMWLANLQCKRWVAEKAAWLTKTKAEKQATLLERKNVSIARVKSGKSRLGPKAVPLKLPADHFIPRVIWKDIHRRARRLTWRESDDAFTRRGFRNAFKFYPSERNRAPWLEALMYNRSLYSTNLREFRRRQFPREQKKYKWLQRVRKSLFPGRTNTYIKGRRWPRIRMYNQRLHYSLFSLPDRNAARRHFKKLNGRSRTIGFVHAQEGLSNRLDNVLMHLNMAPTIFWARHVATRGLLRINGRIVSGADYRLKAGDFIEPVWDRVIKYRHFFKNPVHRREEKMRHSRWSPTGVSSNFEYHPTLRSYTYHGHAREDDLRKSSRLQPHLFRWFRLDSGAKKSVT